MKTHHPFVRALLLSVLMGMLVASAALAKSGGLGFIRLSSSGTSGQCPSASPSPSPSPSESPSPSPSPSESPSSDQGDQDEQGDQNDQGTSDEQASDDQGDQNEQGDQNDQGTSDEQASDDCKDQTSDQAPQSKPSPSADRTKACMDAAGLSTGTPGPGQGKTTGLDHAIEMVLANCIKNPQAPGLLNALRHLVANRDLHAAHDAEKAARKAAHEAAKAAKGHSH